MSGPASPKAQNQAKSLLQRALDHLNRNELAQAEALLATVQPGASDEAQALQLMGVVRRAQGRLSDAEVCYRRALTIDPAQLQSHHNLGSLLQTMGRTDEAIAEIREAIRLKPNFADAHLNLALALAEKGDHAAAEKSCSQALRLQPNLTIAKQCLASELCALGRPKEAESILRQALALGIRNPRQAAALEHNLGIALKQQERFDEALRLFDSAQAKVPEMPAVDYNRGSTYQQLGHPEKAAAFYRRALAREPDSADTLAALAFVLVQTGNFTEARGFGERAVAIAPEHTIAQIALAIVDAEESKFSAAKEKLKAVLDDPALDASAEASFALGFAADAFDRHGRYSEAFAIHQTSNERRRAIQLPGVEGGRVIDDVARLTAYFENCTRWPASPPAARSAAAAGHVFLLGFMRSGTTLLETILTTNPQVVGVDEIEFLTNPSRAFLLSETGLDRLATLSADEAEEWRSAYWKAVRDTGLSVAGKTFIDKMPFNSLRLPLIARLFPTAKILFALRDPRDVVFSCFRRRFNPTPHSFEFLRLADCARYFASTMTLVSHYRDKLPLDLREHRYEDIVADFDGTIRAICEFAGVEWNRSMRDFGGVASAIDRRSASAAQVRRGLYQGAAGQWRPYAEQMQPVLPILAQWVRKFGYPVD